MSRRDSDRPGFSSWFAATEEDGSADFDDEAVGSAEGFAVRKDGSNSRVLSSVRGMFSARRRWRLISVTKVEVIYQILR